MSDKPNELETSSKPKKNLFFAVTVLIVLAVVVAYILFKPATQTTNIRHEAETKPQPIVAHKPAEEPETVAEPLQEMVQPEPVVRPEVRETEPEPKAEPLPTLDESDQQIITEVEQYLPETAMSLLVNDDMIRRAVVYIDNLSKGKLANKHNPVTKPEESFSVREGAILTIDPNSYERYTPYVKILTSMSSAQIVRLYDEYKPLINDAYAEIGYSDYDFNDTLIHAIDLLLDTPEPEGELPLLRDSVTYQYALSEWEQLPAAQKQLLRMGPENMKQIKSVLSKVKQQLANK